MSTKSYMQKAVSWFPHVFAFCIAVALVWIFWPWKTADVCVWKSHGQGLVRHAHPGALAWKQSVMPMQYMQGSCGSCHRADLAQTPRLNHGRQLLVRYNCIGCHQLQDVDRPAMLGPDLTSVGTKVSREWIYKWLKEPRTITDADGNTLVDGVATNPRMPKFNLSEQELRALSAYLSVQRAKPVAPYHFNPRVVAAANKSGDVADQGKIRFDQMFCVTCHSLAVDRGGETTLIGGDIGPELTKVGSKVKPEWLVAWLLNPEGYLQHTKMPQYQWSDKDLYEVSQYIERRLTDPDLLSDVPKLGAPTDAEVELGRQLFQDKGCVQCHAIQGVAPRKNFGPDLSAFGMAAGPYLFQVNSARSLHFAEKRGGVLDISVSKVPKFMIAYIQNKVTNPTSVTPAARMPQFHMSQTDVEDVATALLSMTGIPSTNSAGNSTIVPQPHPEFHPDGPFGALYQRYKCYVCHSFNGYGGTLAPELSYEGSRSQRDWLVQFLKNPQTLRPTLTSRMPEFNMPDKDATTIANYISASLRKSDVNPDAVNPQTFTPQMAASGQQLYNGKYQCQSCHTIGASGGYVGPSLNNVGNWLNAAWIEAWLRNPQALVPGTIEPRQSFTDDEIKEITAYLLTLKQSSSAGDAGATAAMGGQ